MRYAIVTGDTVENVISWDGESSYLVSDGKVLIQDVDGWAEVGGHYENGSFYPPKPYPSWIFNESNRTWNAPYPYPTDGGNYVWEESIETWWPVNQA